MASSLIFPVIMFISLFTIPSSFSSPQKSISSFQAHLIHHSSPQSSFYNPKDSHADIIRDAFHTSLARNLYFKNLLSSKTSGITAPTSVNKLDLVMTCSIGSPPIQTYGILDTDSSLLWLQCLPCNKCYNQAIPIFDPTNSSTYKAVACKSVECTSTPDTKCNEAEGKCEYASYRAESSTAGVIATETVMLLDGGSTGNINLPNMVFGCGHNNFITGEDPKSPGIVGLCREHSSLIGQLMLDKFSYCISSNISGGGRNFIKFGSPAEITGTQMSLLSGKHGFYYLSVEDMAVDGIPLNISKSVFSLTDDGQNGFMIDTGTTYTALNTIAMKALMQEIQGRMDENPEEDQDEMFALRYKDITNTPEIEFQFTGENFPLSKVNTWILNSHGQYCLAMIGTDNGVSRLGMYQMRDVNVGYGLTNNKVSFKYANCPTQN